MTLFNDKKDCCGCNACGDACALGAISFVNDSEGFWYPRINSAVCVNCGKCLKVCPLHNIDSIKRHEQKMPVVFGGYNKNLMIRFDSTSGGAFSTLALEMYRQKGYVAGAVQNSDLSVTNFISNKKSDLARLRSSKYVQSTAEGLYKRIKELLEAGEKVLACGSPCQMAALRSYLCKCYDNLVIVDFICRATNSPKVYRKYIEWLESKYNSKVVAVKAKNKDLGWRSLARKVTFENGEIYYGAGYDDHYRRGYHRNYYERPSCYDCKFKGFPRCADITLGDFWGIEKVDGSLDHNLGTSCILLNTKKGEEFFSQVKDKMEIKRFTLDQVLAGNREPLMTPIKYPQCDREALFRDLDLMQFDEWANKYFPISSIAPARRSIRGLVRWALSLLKFILRHPVIMTRRIRWNVLCKSIKADFMRGHILEVNRCCAFDFKDNSILRVEGGVFRFGTHKNAKSCKETDLFMDEGSEFRIKGGGYIGCGADVQLFKKGRLEFGRGVCINSGFQLVCADEIVIGDDVHIGRDVWVRDNNGEHYIIQPGYTWKAPVKIGSHCWIGSCVKIMKGVMIGEGTVVAANSVVSQSLPAHCIVSGNPAKVVAENVIWRP